MMSGDEETRYQSSIMEKEDFSVINDQSGEKKTSVMNDN